MSHGTADPGSGAVTVRELQRLARAIDQLQRLSLENDKPPRWIFDRDMMGMQILRRVE